MLLLFVFLLKHYWPIYVKQGLVFDVQSVRIVIPAFVALFLLVAAAGGVYDKTYTPGKAIYASMIAILVTLASYSLLPEYLRFSRGVILLGGILGMLSMMLVRALLFKWGVLQNVNEDKEFHQTLIVGTQQEYDEVTHLMHQAQRKERVLGRISVVEGDNKALGSVSNLKHLLVHLPCKEIIFCEGRMSFEQIIQYINVVPENARIKFHANKSMSIIGSDDKDSSGEALGSDENFAITQPYQKRSKRLLDIISSVLFLISFPFHLLLVKKPFAFLGHSLQVLMGRKTWIGYCTKNKLPQIKNAVFTSNGYPAETVQELPAESLQTIDYWYAKDYDWLNDAKLIAKYYRCLGDK
jgi:O-antigen biosynthesis protein